MNLSRHLPRLICNTILIVMAVLGTVFCVSSAFALQVSVFPLVLITILSGAVFESFLSGALAAKGAPLCGLSASYSSPSAISTIVPYIF